MSNRADKILSARGVKMSFAVGRDRLEILKGVDIDVVRGETTSITGVSGSGKTTLLHILGALERPTAGTVDIDGRNIYRMSERQLAGLRAKTIGYVFQAYHLLPELDVIDNVILPAMSSPRWVFQARQARERALALLDKVGLADRAGHRPTELSGGEQQRAAIARALMNDPEIIFADEPTGNLDEHTSDLVLGQLMDIAGDLHRTLVMVTHNREVAALCNHQLVLEDGHLQNPAD